MNKKYSKLLTVLILTVLVSALFQTQNVLAESEKSQVSVYFFYSRTCSVCAKEKPFLENLAKEHSEIDLQKFDLYGSEENFALIKKFYENYNVSSNYQGSVPITFIDEKYFCGWWSEDITGREIENYILQLIDEFQPEPEPEPEPNPEPNPYPEPESNPGPEQESNKKIIVVPFFGQIEIPQNISPLFLAVFLGTLDGFNACAMVALGFLLTVLISTGIRRRVILIGGTFILVSGLVYFLIISGILKLILFSGHEKIINIAVGVIIIVFSVFLLKDYFQGVVCKVCEIGNKKENILAKIQKNLFAKMKTFSSARMSLPIMLLGVALVATGVNVVELVCSFGFPLTFSNILRSANLSAFSYYFYIFIFVLFYMLDDFIIFLIAVYTLRMTQVSQKYLKFIKLVSGIVLLVMGLTMLFRPELLVF